MKSLVAVVVAISIIAIGAYDCLKFRKTTIAIEEILKLLNIFRNGINYRKASYADLISTAQSQDFRYISFDKDKMVLDCTSSCVCSKFDALVENIGTTDVQGQLSICGEFIEGFTHMLAKQRAKESSKMQVNLSLSLLGALTVIILEV